MEKINSFLRPYGIEINCKNCFKKTLEYSAPPKNKKIRKKRQSGCWTDPQVQKKKISPRESNLSRDKEN